MRYAGIDVHKDMCHATVIDEEGELVKEGYFENISSKLVKFFDGIEDAKVAIEAADAWQPVYDQLVDMGHDVKLAHPHKTRIIAEVKIKTDCRDSEALADLVRAGLIPEVYVPCEQMRELRRTVRRRGKLVMERSKYISRIKAELRIRRINSGVNVLTKKGKRWLRKMEIDAVDDYLRVIDTLDERIGKLEDEIDETAGEMEEAQILTTVAGIGNYSALTIIAEIATVERFPDSEKLCSYAGLVPSVRQSGPKVTHGPISGGRPLLRWILVQCAWNHVNNDENSHITRFYKRLVKVKHEKVAIVAAARKLLKAIYWMLKLGEGFHPEGFDPRISR